MYLFLVSHVSGEVSDDVDEDINPTASSTVDLPILCDGNIPIMSCLHFWDNRPIAL